MPTPENILSKLKLLIKLRDSSNPNESDNARVMADRLISKYNITDEEIKSLEDKKPLYGEDEKLFVTFGIEGWRQQLALGIAQHFECQIIQEEVVPLEGIHQFNYYVYGDSDEVANVKFVYHSFIQKIEEVIKNKCAGRGPIYLSSFAEGMVEAIKNNIRWDGIELPTIKPKTASQVSGKILESGDAKIVKEKTVKEKPADQSVDVNSQSLIKDIAAYFKGLQEGQVFSLQDVLELAAENDRAKELT
jgi:hypothetical protein